MAAVSDMTDRHARDLAALAALGMELARDLQGAALAAADPEEKASLAAAFHRVARTVRQSMALEARLEREARRVAAETQAEAVARRKAQVRARVRDMVWNEAEASDCADLIADLDDRLSDAEHLPGFAGETVEAHIATLRAQLGLEPGVPAARRRTGTAAAGPIEIQVRFVDADPDEELSAGHLADEPGRPSRADAAQGAGVGARPDTG